MSRIKGTGILQVVKALRAIGESARAAVPPHLQHYLEERISTTEMYPDGDWLELTRALVGMMPVSPDDVWETLGRISANHDLTGVYRGMVVKGAFPEALAGLRNVFHFYHDTGRLVVSSDATHAHVELHDYAHVADEYCRFVRGFAGEYLKLAIGYEVVLRKIQCRAQGAAFCSWEIVRPPRP